MCYRNRGDRDYLIHEDITVKNDKKTILYIFIGLLEISNYSYSQNSMYGVYTHTFDNKVELLELKSDSTFWYCYGCSLKNSWGDGNSWGYWEVKDSMLILTSTMPERIDISENCNKRSKSSIIWIYPSNFPNKPYLNYDLYIVTNKNDTLSFLNQSELKVEVKERIKTFWIKDIDTGLQSKPYTISSKKKNLITVLFYSGKVFDKENWLIMTVSIKLCK